jgi:hypothetical protein
VQQNSNPMVESIYNPTVFQWRASWLPSCMLHRSFHN